MTTVLDQGHIIEVQRWDRWSVNRRLQDLKIPCTCPTDGTLRVTVNHATALILVHSVVRRFTGSRNVRIEWLERCWDSEPACIPNP